MAERDIAVGRYLAADTVLHRVDARLKIAAVVAGSVVIFLYSSGWALLAFAVLTAMVLVSSRLPLLEVLRSLRTVWVILLLTALLQFFLTPGEVVASLGFVTITDTGLYNGVIFSSRVVVLVVLVAALTLTTSPLGIADGLESILRPLGYVKVPVSRAATVISITLMFIPNILEQSRRVVRAQAARGADFDSPNPLKRVRDILPVLVPLFVKVFHDADELALAMEARAYTGGRGRTRLHPMKMHAAEAAFTAAYAGAAIALIFIF